MPGCQERHSPPEEAAAGGGEAAFREKGNAAFIRPLYVRQVVDKIWDLGGRPFLTDANTVYLGARSESVSHLTTAIENGFAYAVVRAPLVIADGLTGKAEVEVKLNVDIMVKS